MNDEKIDVLNAQLKSIAYWLEEIAKLMAQSEQRIAAKAAKKAQKKAAALLKAK